MNIMINFRAIPVICCLLLTACSSDDSSSLEERLKASRAKAEEINRQKALEEKTSKEEGIKKPSKEDKEIKTEPKTEAKPVDPYEDVRHLFEADFKINERLTEKNIVGVVGLVVFNGYKCDTLSAITPFAFGTGFYVYCNQYSYSYDVEDKGGNWVVTLN